jgi:hypothetical protein
MGKVNCVILDKQGAGHSPWRDRESPYDYSALSDELAAAATYIITNPPSAWMWSEDKGWKVFTAIYGQNATEKARKTGCVPENTSAVWVIGTLVKQQGQNELEEALKAKSEGRIFGYDVIRPAQTDHTGMYLVDNPLGIQVWAKGSDRVVSNMKVSELSNTIRKILQEELQAIINA